MQYDIRLGLLAADAISKFSKATHTKDVVLYQNFLDTTSQYCEAVRKVYGRPVEADIPASDAMEGALAEFMRTVVETQRPSPAVTAKLQEVSIVETLIQKIRQEHRLPSDEECLRIAKTIYATSAADPR